MHSFSVFDFPSLQVAGSAFWRRTEMSVPKVRRTLCAAGLGAGSCHRLRARAVCKLIALLPVRPTSPRIFGTHYRYNYSACAARVSPHAAMYESGVPFTTLPLSSLTAVQCISLIHRRLICDACDLRLDRRYFTSQITSQVHAKTHSKVS